jgi:hypothetical protein
MRLFRSWLIAAIFAAPAASGQAAEPSDANPSKVPPPTEEITVVGQRPVTPTTSYWVEDAYTQYPLLGPNFAQGLVIWNHSDPWNSIGPSVPPIRAMEGMAALGWDVVRLQRNGRISLYLAGQLGLLKEEIAQQIATAKAQGYKRIILAGQEVGGALALEAGMAIDRIYAVIAFAPNTGIEWCGRQKHHIPCPSGQPLDVNAGAILTDTWNELSHIHPTRLFVLFPQDDEEVPHLRGPTARDILGHRADLPFVLVDEAGGVRTTFGADKPEFDAYASCMDLFVSPDLSPRAGEFHCGADEIPLALAQMGVRQHGGDAWFGYDTRGQAIYLEFPGGSRSAAVYGWGAGANGKTRPGTRNLDVKFSGESFTAALTSDQLIRGAYIGPQLRLTIDREDGTRTAVAMRRITSGS